ncbi:MAG: tetratricopeptide repeat protein [Holophagales bacterium]|nr:tetratricopeptide repeat protein [Holophagales bacterium]MYF96772.1 tetratricopeptide repeat protein [Holophagales bacterium]
MPTGKRRREARDADTTRREVAAGLALALIVVAAFFPALQGDFVWDDVAFAEEPVIHSNSGLRNIWLTPGDIRNEGHYWPLTYTTFWLEHKLWGLAPVGYHIVNLLLYIGNVLLLWQLCRRLDLPGAWAAAAIWAVHPLHVESVAWIIERKDVLSGLLYLASALAYLNFAETGRRSRHVLGLTLYALGLLAKSAVVTLPAALLIGHWWRRGRLKARDFLSTAPFFAVGLLISLGDMAFYRSREVLSLDYSLTERFLIAARALWFYTGKLVWPSELAVIYPLWDIRAGDPAAWAYLAAAVAVGAALWYGRRGFGRGPLAGTLFFAVTLSPALGFVNYGYMQFSFAADRFQYLAGFGLIAVLVGATEEATRRFARGRKQVVAALLCALLVALGTATWRQARVWRNEVTLFGHVVSSNPAARDAHLNWSVALHKAGRYEESLAASRVAVELRPDSPDAHSNLGRALLRSNEFDAAEASFHRALEIEPGHRNANQNLAEAMRKQGRFSEAIDRYRIVLARDEDFSLAWAGLADALFRAGRHEEALEAAGQALGIDPDLTAAGPLRLVMGKAERELGRYDEAERNLEFAARLAPESPDPLFELAALAAARGRPEEADRHVARAEALHPRSPATLHARAETLRAQQRLDAALAAYEEALELDPGFAPALAGMGALMFQLERHEEAVVLIDRALATDPALPEATALLRLSGRELQALGRPEEAAERFARVLAINAADTEALDHLAFLTFHGERYDDALDLYRALAETDAANAGTRTNIGITLLKLARYDEAIRTLEEVISLDPGQESARVALEEARRLARDGTE